jgi:hypothetical protein
VSIYNAYDFFSQQNREQKKMRRESGKKCGTGMGNKTMKEKWNK